LRRDRVQKNVRTPFLSILVYQLHYLDYLIPQGTSEDNFKPSADVISFCNERIIDGTLYDVDLKIYEYNGGSDNFDLDHQSYYAYYIPNFKSGMEREKKGTFYYVFKDDTREECGIPQVKYVRQYEAIDELPAGQQMQMDFGQIGLRSSIGRIVTLYFVTFVLAHSRHKYVEWLDRPFTTRDLINAHENAFEYYGGMTKEIVYDQDHLILVSENAGDLLLTKEFADYHKNRKFKIYMCKKADPETKGKVENVVKFVKRNFARNRTFHNLEKLNEDCLAWLERTGNGKVHNTTKKIPAEVFALEKQHLIPVPHKINFSTTKIITRVIRKDNTITYQGNRYALPLGSYEPDRKVTVHEDEGMLIISNEETQQEIIRYPLCIEKGRLIKSSDCRREKDKGIEAYLKEVVQILNDSPEASSFLNQVRQDKPRYIRDQLKIIKDHSKDKSPELIKQALNYCLKNHLYGATDFVDTLNYFASINCPAEGKRNIENTLQPLHENNRSVFKTRVEVRDMGIYIKELQGVNQCQ
jgi:hypothetical protein